MHEEHVIRAPGHILAEALFIFSRSLGFILTETDTVRFS